jgi:hypothetical protein
MPEKNSTSFITYEQAKWLLEKGFDLIPYLKIDNENPLNLKSNYNPREYQPWYFEFSQSQMSEFLLQKFDIFVEIRGWARQPQRDEIWNRCFHFFVNGVTNSKYFKTPQEAYSSAFDLLMEIDKI